MRYTLIVVGSETYKFLPEFLKKLPLRKKIAGALLVSKLFDSVFAIKMLCIHLKCDPIFIFEKLRAVLLYVPPNISLSDVDALSNRLLYMMLNAPGSGTSMQSFVGIPVAPQIAINPAQFTGNFRIVQK